MKKKVSGIMLTMLLASMLTLTFSIQPVKKSGIISNVGGESGGFEAQSGSVDWWPMFHHDPAHTGYSTSKAPKTNATLWSYAGYSAYMNSPTVADGRVYVTHWTTYALNASTGELIWSYNMLAESHTSPAVADGRVFVGVRDQHAEPGQQARIYALNASTGTLIWTYIVGDTFLDNSPTAVDGVVFIGAENGYVYALNATTGAYIWSYKCTAQIIAASPAVTGGKVYVSPADGNVCALNASTGAFIWNFTTGSAGGVSSPAFAGGVIFVGLYSDHNVCALNASTGALKWSYITGDTVISSPAVVGGKVYVGSNDYKVHCLDASTGSLIWSYTTGSAVQSSPAVADGVVFVGSNDGKVYALNASTGTFVWSYTTGSAVYSSPAIVGGAVYAATMSNVYAFGSHDIGITSSSLSTAEAYSGQIVNVTVVARNEGTFNETFNIRTYCDMTQIGTQTLTDLPPEEERTLTFSWNTTEVPGGYYTISANATIVPGETDTADNNFIDGTIKITSPVRIAEVIPCNQTGYPKDTFELGTLAYFKVTINSTALIPQNILITINLYDNTGIPIGVASFQGLVLPGISTIIFGLPIPTFAFMGTATIYANCYTDWPSQGGFPHCPEMSATLEITGP